MQRVIGYLRVSTMEQSVDKFRYEILQFANQKRFGAPVDFIEEKVSGTVHWTKRELGAILHQLQPGDCIIVPEISRLARSLLQIIEVIEFCREADIAVYAIKGNWALDDSINSKVLSTIMGLMSEIERDLISARTREALAARKASGVKLGRPKGPGKSKLDQFRPEIEALLRNGSRKNFVASRYGVSEMTLYNWLSKNSIDTTPRL